MSRVEWSRHGPTEIEHLVGVLLLRRFPNARRRRPGRGDGGVDVYVPDSDGWTVFQVKSFTGALSTSHKRQIEGSWISFLKFIEERKLRVKHWYLIRPENPTEGDEIYLRRLTRAADWPCQWWGLDHCEELAAAYPDAVDYYVKDGKERLEGVVQAYLRAAGFAGGTDPSASVSTIEAVHESINSIDPHYRYDFRVVGKPSGGWPEKSVAVVDNPPSDLVASSAIYYDDRAVVFDIFAKFEEALTERPVPINFELQLQPGTPEDEAWNDLLTYGIPTPSWIPVGNLSVGLPGGLGMVAAEGQIKVGPPMPSPSADTWTLAILDPNGDQVLASVDLEGVASEGLAGRGWSVSLKDPNGAMTVELRVNLETDTSTYRLTYAAFPGKRPRDILAALKILSAFHAPNQVQLGLAGGPPMYEPMAIGAEENPAFSQISKVMEALTRIQASTPVRLLVPDVETFASQYPNWQLAASLLDEGSVAIPWINLELPDDKHCARMVGDLITVRTMQDFAVEIGDEIVPLGIVTIDFVAAEIVSIEKRNDGDTIVKLKPKDRTPAVATLTTQHGPPAEPNPSCGRGKE